LADFSIEYRHKPQTAQRPSLRASETFSRRCILLFVGNGMDSL
jgi:hypothetical protein